MNDSSQKPTWRKSACAFCYINCGVELAVEGRGTEARILKVRGDRDNPRSQGYLCNKAQSIPTYVQHGDRLRSPLRRRADGSFEPVSWDTAIEEIAARLRHIAETYGGKTLALYGGGGQGNHAGGMYITPLLRLLGSRTTFSALSQEKTGDFWLNGHIFGSQLCHTAEDVHHCDLLLVIGANPKIAHGFTNARDQLNSIRKDPGRKLIVIDPRRTETAEVADLHVAIRPGGDAFLMGALLAELHRRRGFDEEFLAQHATGTDEVKLALQQVPVQAWVAAADVAPADFERLVQMVIDARAMVVRVELGIQQGLNSTLNSYFEKLLFLMTGNFGRPGTNWLHGWLAPMWASTPGVRHAASETEIIAGLVAPNVFPKSVLTDHPERLRALWVESSNPMNTAADTEQARRAIRALDLLVVVDVAFTETAAQAHYVLPASSQYEKCEFTFFSWEAPTNYFHVRAPVLVPLPGTLPEPEIHVRLARALGLLPDEALLAELRAKAADPAAFGQAFASAAASHPNVAKLAPLVLYLTLGPTLPDGTAAAAPLIFACQKLAKSEPEAVQRALGIDAALSAGELGHRLFSAIVESRSGTAITEHTTPWGFIQHSDRKVHLAIPQMLEWMLRLDPASIMPDPQWPFVLSAGQRRLHNANQILRDPAPFRSDPDGALYIHPDDLAVLGVEDQGKIIIESRRARMVVRAKSTDSMRRGHVALPHGYGVAHPDDAGRRVVRGPAVNWLTDAQNKDPVADTPHHKHVPVRLRGAPATAVMNSVELIDDVTR